MVLSPCLMSSSSLNDLAIVVVEDHDDARRYLDLFLVQLGAKVVVASNAFEGLRAIKNTLPNLVLSAIQMPGMDGYELLENICALGCRRPCIGYRNERLFLAGRPRANTSCRLSGMLAEAIHTRQVSGNDSGCLLSLCAELLARSAPTLRVRCKSDHDLNHDVQQSNVNQCSAHQEDGKCRFVVDFHQ
jgi:DNA-binding NarL/FixJ family response regulator